MIYVLANNKKLGKRECLLPVGVDSGAFNGWRPSYL
jgi:hypothetical protein